MKLMTNASYNDLLREIDAAETSLNEERIINRDLNRTIEKLESNNNNLLSERRNLIRERDLLRAKISFIDSSSLKLSNKLRKSNSRCGGLTKHNNKLKKELTIANERLENYKKYFKRNHIQLTINQYDRRIPPLNKRQKCK